MTNKDEARYVAVSKGTRQGHRHEWVDNTHIIDSGTRYECTCGATYFEPAFEGMNLYYLKEGATW